MAESIEYFNRKELDKLEERGGLAQRCAIQIRELSKANLLYLIREISIKFTGQIQAPGIEFSIWRAILTGPKVLSESEIIRLEQLYNICEGWWCFDLDEPVFLDAKEWTKRYDDQENS